jgi:hypothetical protein
MPLKRCTEAGKRGWKWGDRGKCYTYSTKAQEAVARLKAIRQAAAMGEFPGTGKRNR